MRFVIAYLSVFILGIFAVMGLGFIWFGAFTIKLIFTSILFAAPIILVGSTVAEIFYGFSRKATLSRFLLWGFIFGIVMTVLVSSVIDFRASFLIVLVAILAGIIASILAVLFYFIRGGHGGHGKASL